VSGLAATLARRRPALSRSLPKLTPRLKRRLVALLALCLLLAGGYHFWLRDSSLVAVDEVKISGLTTADAPRVRTALAGAARGMTTLHIDHERLERAVEAFPVVRELKVTPDFPHGLRVRVVEHVPAALAVSDAGRVAVAGDGTILRGLPVDGKLPTVAVDGILGGTRLRDPDALAAAAVAGSAPAVLRRRIQEVSKRSDAGLVAELSDGPELIFGAATQLRTKWAAAARVLADPEAEGASYIDLRIASRPAAGGLPAETVTPVAPAGTAPTTPGAPAAGAATATEPGAAQAPADPSQAIDPATGAVPEAPATTPTTPPATTTEPPATTIPPAAPAPLPAGGVEGGATAPTVP
jgi:cell division protein FtsQ